MTAVLARSAIAAMLRVADEPVTCLVGGGGKTSLLLAFGASIGRSVLTTTTKMGADRAGGFRVIWSPDGGLPPIDSPTLVWREQVERKALGFEPEVIDRWAVGLGAPIVVEADGARHLPFKAPAPHEPVIPSTTTLVVAVIGADALGRVIADQCFRPLRVAAVAGCSPYERLTPQRAATVLCSPRGSAAGLPPASRFAIAVTKVDAANRSLVEELAEALAGIAATSAVPAAATNAAAASSASVAASGASVAASGASAAASGPSAAASGASAAASAEAVAAALASSGAVGGAVDEAATNGVDPTRAPDHVVLVADEVPG